MENGSNDDQYDWLYSGGSRTPEYAAPQSSSSDQLPPPALPPAGKTKGTKQGKPRGPIRGLLRILTLILTAWLVFTIAVPLVNWPDIVRVDANPGSDRPLPGATTTFVLAGTDERPSDRSRGRTDTLLLLTFGSGPTVLTSIPRDSQVTIPGHGRTKVNAAFAYGGPPLLVQTLEQETGLRIDGFVQLGFDGLVNVVDAVGGIEICPERDLKDKDSKLDIKAGCQIVDGTTALAYSRNRKSYATGDIARGQAQREVIGAIGKSVAQAKTVINPIRWMRTNSAAADSLAISENISMIEFTRFSWALLNAMSGTGLNCTVPIRDLRVTWDESRASSYFTHLRNGTAEQLGNLCTEDGIEK